MITEVTIKKCKTCGRRGIIHKCDGAINGVYYTDLYIIKCLQCGKSSAPKQHIEMAIEDWNLSNTPNKVKPTYHCGNCGKEIHLGFLVCPHCNAEVDW